MNAIENLAQNRGKNGLWLFTNSNQEGQFYEKMGFTKIGEIPRYIGQNSEILYIKNLKD